MLIRLQHSPFRAREVTAFPPVPSVPIKPGHRLRTISLVIESQVTQLEEQFLSYHTVLFISNQLPELPSLLVRAVFVKIGCDIYSPDWSVFHENHTWRYPDISPGGSDIGGLDG